VSFVARSNIICPYLGGPLSEVLLYILKGSCLANKHHTEISYNHAHEMVYFEMYMIVGEKMH